jgi:hypothetical protein
MAMRYYDVLEGLYRRLDEWRASDEMSKDDVLDSVRESVLNLMTHVVTTPLIGTAYAYPGDMEGLNAWLEPNNGNTNTTSSMTNTTAGAEASSSRS